MIGVGLVPEPPTAPSYIIRSYNKKICRCMPAIKLRLELCSNVKRKQPTALQSTGTFNQSIINPYVA